MMWRLSRLITRSYFSLLEPMRGLERRANGPANAARFHRKYGKGASCMIADCTCKRGRA